MTRNEYEARRRRLDEELRAAMELLKAGHLAQVQMLDLLWKMATDGTEIPTTAATPPPPAPQPPQQRRRRREPGTLMDEVIGLLPQLPEVFTRDDILQGLSEPADRSSLFRVLQELQRSGWFKLERPGQGRCPAAYRQTWQAEEDTNLSPETPDTAPGGNSTQHKRLPEGL